MDLLIWILIGIIAIIWIIWLCYEAKNAPTIDNNDKILNKKDKNDNGQ